MATKTLDITGQVTGVATSFVLPDTIIATSLVVHWNGTRLRPTVEFAETGPSTFDWIVGPKFPAPKVGDTLQVQYEVLAAGETVLFPLVVASGIPPA